MTSLHRKVIASRRVVNSIKFRASFVLIPRHAAHSISIICQVSKPFFAEIETATKDKPNSTASSWSTALADTQRMIPQCRRHAGEAARIPWPSIILCGSSICWRMTSFMLMSFRMDLRPDSTHLDGCEPASLTYLK
jgi:hypothetical protein